MKNTVKRMVVLTTALLLCLTLLPKTAKATAGTLIGEGTKSAPYLIYTKEDLAAFASIVNGTDGASQNTAACGKVMQSIIPTPPSGDLVGLITMSPIGSEEAPYTGTFSFAENVEIHHLCIEQAAGNHVGLFGYIQNATIQNVCLVEPIIYGDTDVGGIAGVAVNSTIRGCSVSGIPAGDYPFGVRGSESVGGIVGRSKDSSISNCVNKASVYLLLTGETPARHKLGGIAGVATLSQSGTNPVLIDNCQNEGKITCTTANNYECTGGIVGRLVSDSADYRAIVRQCTNSGEVASIEAGTGGIVGYAQNASIERCENTVAVTGTIGVGGIAGYAFYGTQILHCENSGTITGKPYSSDPAQSVEQQPFNVGGIVGAVYNPRDVSHLLDNGEIDCDTLPVYSYNRDSLISNCTNDGTVLCLSDYEETEATVVLVGGIPYVVQMEGAVTGGIAGFAADSAFFDEEGNVVRIELCTNTGTVTGAKEGGNATYTGGVLGCGKNVAVVECSSRAGAVTNAQLREDDSVRDDIGGYSYTVHFNPTGGSIDPSQTLLLTKWDILRAPDTPTRSDYLFTGWYTDEALTTVFDFEADRVNAPITLYAGWQAKRYTVSFDSMGGSAVRAKTDVQWTDAVLAGVSSPTKTGWTFIGWKCGDTAVTAETTYGELAAAETVLEVRLEAQWKIAPATDTPNGGNDLTPDKAPQTGDLSNAWLWSALLAAGLLTVATHRKKQTFIG